MISTSFYCSVFVSTGPFQNGFVLACGTAFSSAVMGVKFSEDGIVP